MGSLAFYQLSGQLRGKDSITAFRMTMQWEIWSFVIPAGMLSGMFLYEAICGGQADTVEVLEDPDIALTSRPSAFMSSHPNIISLSQHVSVIEEEDKSEGSEKLPVRALRF
jgi:hypothetical protein